MGCVDGSFFYANVESGRVMCYNVYILYTRRVIWLKNTESFWVT